MKTMKKMIKFLLYIVSLILLIIINPITIFIFGYIQRKIYSMSAKIRIKKCGKNFNIGKGNYLVGLNNICIGNGFNSMDGLWLATYKRYGDHTYTPEIIIGNNFHCSRNCHIGAVNRIIIGDNVLLGSNVLIEDHSHGVSELSDLPRYKMELVSKGSIEIGKNVWICDNVCVLPGVKIGDNCIIGANSIVNKDIPDNCVAVGNPARAIKQLERKLT